MLPMKCPSPTCSGLMDGRPYFSFAGLRGVRFTSTRMLEGREPDGFKFDCATCGATVDIPIEVEQTA